LTLVGENAPERSVQRSVLRLRGPCCVSGKLSFSLGYEPYLFTA
jgi:hypothetical protein